MYVTKGRVKSTVELRLAKHLLNATSNSDMKQGVVTYMSHVEVLVKGIKIESRDQSPFGRLIKGSRQPPNCQNHQIRNAQLQFDL